MRVAIYARQSRDKKTSISQQIDLGREVCEDNGWVVHDIYQDGVSASRFETKTRPDWDRLVKNLTDGLFDVLWLWESSRGDRDAGSWIGLLSLCRERGVQVYVHTYERTFDVAKGTDWRSLALDGIDAAYESEKTSARILRMTAARAKEGKPHGMVAYGYRRVREVDDQGRVVSAHDEIHPEQAEVIKQAATRLLRGESLRSVVRALNDQGSRSPRGVPWSSTTLRQIMLRDRNAGLRRHRGVTVGKADWEPIYDEDTHRRVVALLTDPSRKVTTGATRKHLLSGLARCGRCAGTMRAISPTKSTVAKYQCKDCFRVGRKKDDVDKAIEALVVARLSKPDALKALATGRPQRAEELSGLIEGATARLNVAADGFADGELTTEQLKRINAKLRPQIDSWKTELASCAPHEGVLHLTGPDAKDRWEGSSLDTKRAVISLLMDVEIRPVGSGAKFSGEGLKITWK